MGGRWCRGCIDSRQGAFCLKYSQLGDQVIYLHGVRVSHYPQQRGFNIDSLVQRIADVAVAGQQPLDQSLHDGRRCHCCELLDICKLRIVQFEHCPRIADVTEDHQVTRIQKDVGVEALQIASFVRQVVHRRN